MVAAGVLLCLAIIVRAYMKRAYQKDLVQLEIEKAKKLSQLKEETGEPPINYLIKLRLEKAREQLESQTEDSVKTISNSVGYEDVYYFSKLFKKYYGMSPLNYKSNYRKIS